MFLYYNCLPDITTDSGLWLFRVMPWVDLQCVIVVFPDQTDLLFIKNKVRKTAKIKNRYNQVPHLTQDNIWESNKITINITKFQKDRSAKTVVVVFTRSDRICDGQSGGRTGKNNMSPDPDRGRHNYKSNKVSPLCQKLFN